MPFSVRCKNLVAVGAGSIFTDRYYNERLEIRNRTAFAGLKKFLDRIAKLNTIKETRRFRYSPFVDIKL